MKELDYLVNCYLVILRKVKNLIKCNTELTNRTPFRLFKNRYENTNNKTK